MFRELEHTADVAVGITAATLEELFSEAAYGMMHTLYGGNIQNAFPEITVTFSVDGYDNETFLVSFLSELLYLNETKRLVAVDCAVSFSGDTLKACIRGYAGNAPIKEIKAVTFHDLKIKFTDSGYAATVVFDV